MQLIAGGLNHTTAPLALRERMAVSPDALPAALAALRERFPESLVLSTCNRVEVYAIAERAEGGPCAPLRLLAAHLGVSDGALSGHTYAYAGAATVRHLFRVASGLDSMVTGERQILHQVRQALDAACAAGAAGPLLRRLGAQALACGKRVRARTGLGGRSTSVAALALSTVARERGGLADAHVVVLGAGETAALALKRLSRFEPARITVVSRTFDRAQALAARHGATALPLLGLADVLADADVLIAAVTVPEPIVHAAMLGPSRPRPLLCADLGVPRAIAADVATVPDVSLIDMDRLQAVAERNAAERDRQAQKAETIVAEAVTHYVTWWQAREVIPTIAGLRARAEQIREAEISRALARLPGLSEREQFVVRGLAARIVSKLLHAPTMALKNDPEAAQLAAALRVAFSLDAAVMDAMGDGDLPDATPAAARPVPDFDTIRTT